MKYDSYRKKVKTFAGFMRFVVKHIIAISIATGTVLAVAATLLSTKGIVVTKEECPAEIVFGEELGYQAGAFLSSASYEYAIVGSDEWSTEMPDMPGDYMVRAVADASFGGTRHGTPQSFSIKPRTVKVQAAEMSASYGAALTPVAQLVGNDRIVESSVEYRYFNDTTARVSVVLESLRVFDENGRDVTARYNFVSQSTDVSIAKRDVVVKVNGGELVYNGEEQSFES